MAAPALRIRIAPKFPTKIQPGVGIGVARSGGVVTIRQDWGNIQPPIGALPDGVEMLVRDPAGGSFYKAVPDDFAALAVSTYVIPTRAIAMTKRIPAAILAIETSGYGAPGDGGGAPHKRVPSEPPHVGKFRSVDRFLPNGTVDAVNGGWWEIAATVLDTRMFGASPSASAATNLTSIQGGLDTAAALDRSLRLGPGKHYVDNYVQVASGVEFFGIYGVSEIAAATTSGTSSYGQVVLMVLDASSVRIHDLVISQNEAPILTGGHHAVRFINSDTYVFERNIVNAPMIGISSRTCHTYWITHNKFRYASNGVSAVGAMIDQWNGAHDAVIAFNDLDGGSTGTGVGAFVGILVTAVDIEPPGSTLTPTPRFKIIGNTVRRVRSTGIWVDGHRPTLTLNAGSIAFDVSHNIVEDITENHGITAHGGYGCAINNNQVRRTTHLGISFVGTGGGMLGSTILNNILEDINLGGGVGGSAGSAILLNNGTEYCIVDGNIVRGTTHFRALSLVAGANNNVVGGSNLFLPGVATSGILISDAGTNNSISDKPTSGTYTPTATSVANVAAVTARQCRWTRDRNFVTVTGRIDVTPTAAASTSTQVRLSLPVASDLASAITDLAGTLNSSFGVNGAISADVTNNEGLLAFPAPNTSSNTLYFWFQYVVLPN